MSRLAAFAVAALAASVAAGCAGARSPTPAPEATPSPEPAPRSAPVPRPVPPTLTAAMGRDQAAGLHEETLTALREVERILDGLDGARAEAQADSVTLVRGLVDQSRRALDAGDLERAHNLADKALTLAHDLGG